MNTDPSVDQYIAAVADPASRAALTRLRQVIREAAPDAEERISYGIPSYIRHGYLAGFAAFKKHCSFIPGSTVKEFLDRLTDYKTSKGAIQFKPDNPIPESLIREILAARMKHLRASSEASAKASH